MNARKNIFFFFRFLFSNKNNFSNISCTNEHNQGRKKIRLMEKDLNRVAEQ
jgi:hypothetical protein